MNTAKNSALLLVLGVPFVLYAAWQVHSATRLDASGSAPADGGPTKEQLAASGAKAATAATETRKAVEAVWAAPKNAPPPSPADPAPVAGVMKAAAARTTNLTDLETFLADIEKPFTGELKAKYEGWVQKRANTQKSKEAIQAWLGKPPAINSAADAETAGTEIAKLLSEYAGQSLLANKADAAVWRLRARLHIVEELTRLANREYETAAKTKLPLERGANAGKNALAALGELKRQLATLKDELRQATESKAALDPVFRAGAEAKSANADEYTAREELLSLFAQEDLFDNPAGAEGWLKRVHEQYAKTKDRTVQKLIRDKVQEFADAFVPPAVLLDESVLLQGKPVARSAVTISYEEKLGGKRKTASLAADATGLTEFELAQKPPGVNQLVSDGSKEYQLSDVKPTDTSKAARVYNDERAKLSARAAPRWTSESVSALKKACEGQKDLVDQLRTPEQKAAGKPPKVATRVLGLAAGMAACKELLEPVP